VSCQVLNERRGTRSVPGCGAMAHTSTDSADRGRGYGDMKHEDHIDIKNSRGSNDRPRNQSHEK
jgi:hypothetical protein